MEKFVQEAESLEAKRFGDKVRKERMMFFSTHLPTSSELDDFMDTLLRPQSEKTPVARRVMTTMKTGMTRISFLKVNKSRMALNHTQQSKTSV